jgi:hypothetical protein
MRLEPIISLKKVKLLNKMTLPTLVKSLKKIKRENILFNI